MVLKVLFSNIKLIISIIVVIVCIVYQNELKLFYETFVTKFDPEDKPGIYSNTKLAQFNGVDEKKLYLAVLGTVFDVTEGQRHYKKGAAYHYFIGKDGSRALITGHFTDETDEKDHVMDFSCNDLFTLVHWRNTFREKYIEVGVVIGRFFDKNGDETDYAKQLKNKVKQCQIEKERSQQEDQKYPPCNIAWSADEGTKVWCGKSSGGVKRNWIGVPRQLYTPGVDKPRCVCINIDEEVSPGLLKEYDNCPKTSIECTVKT